MNHMSCLAFGDLNIYQLYQLLRLRQEVFVVEQDCVYLDADGFDTKGWHVLGYDDDNLLIAYARILPKGTSYDDFISLGRVVTAQHARRNGYARTLMLKTLEYVEDLFGNQPIKISAQTYLIPFYESLGFQKTGAEYLEDGIPHIAMVHPAP
jgi:ElaA protein